MIPAWLIAACTGTALAYSMVGLGGGSTYLALLALADLETDRMRVLALTLNVFVSASGLYNFARAGHFRLHLLLPFAVASIPAAALGGSIQLPRQVFLALLAIALSLAAARMFLWRPPTEEVTPVTPKVAWRLGPLIGAGLGLLAGLVGIGGGIFLGPVIILLGWADARKAAAVSAAFILLNSLAGLTGLVARGSTLESGAWPLILGVLVAGQVGSRLGAYRLKPLLLQRWFGVLVLFVAVRLTWNLVV